MSKSAVKRFACIDATLHKTEFFEDMYMLLLENEAQMDQNNYGTMLFMSKQISLSKISGSCKK